MSSSQSSSSSSSSGSASNPNSVGGSPPSMANIMKKYRVHRLDYSIDFSKCLGSGSYGRVYLCSKSISNKDQWSKESVSAKGGRSDLYNYDTNLYVAKISKESNLSYEYLEIERDVNIFALESRVPDIENAMSQYCGSFWAQIDDPIVYHGEVLVWRYHGPITLERLISVNSLGLWVEALQIDLMKLGRVLRNLGKESAASFDHDLPFSVDDLSVVERSLLLCYVSMVVAQKLLYSLSLLHDAHVVHRDVKPMNVILDGIRRTMPHPNQNGNSKESAGVNQRDSKKKDHVGEDDNLPSSYSISSTCFRFIDFGSAAVMQTRFQTSRYYDPNKSPCDPLYVAPERFLNISHAYVFDVYSVGIILMRIMFPELNLNLLANLKTMRGQLNRYSDKYEIQQNIARKAPKRVGLFMKPKASIHSTGGLASPPPSSCEVFTAWLRHEYFAAIQETEAQHTILDVLPSELIHLLNQILHPDPTIRCTSKQAYLEITRFLRALDHEK